MDGDDETYVALVLVLVSMLLVSRRHDRVHATVDITSSTEADDPLVRAARPELAMLVPSSSSMVTRLCHLPE
jgi:hypothetical protein